MCGLVKKRAPVNWKYVIIIVINYATAAGKSTLDLRKEATTERTHCKDRSRKTQDRKRGKKITSHKQK